MTVRAVIALGLLVGTTAILAAGVTNYALTALSLPDAGRAPVLTACAVLAVVVLMASLAKHANRVDAV